ncbi:MAG: AMP-binding protein [Anaerovoracaceae bacterium]|jgi:long-chain acyl-CoA synthetase
MSAYPFNKIDFYDTFPQYVSGLAQKYGDMPAISSFNKKKEEERHSFSDLEKDVISLGEAFIHLSFNGEHIAIVGENSYHWILIYLACLCTGGVAVCIDIEQPEDAIRDMIQRADSRVIFTSPTQAGICEPLLHSEDVKGLYIITDDMDGERSLGRLLQLGKDLREKGIRNYESIAINPDQLGSIVYTSGTTNTSKPVMLSQRNHLYNISESMVTLTPDETVFTALPFYHVYSLNCGVLGNMVRGAHIYINGDIKTAIRDMLLADAKTLIAVPLLVETLQRNLWLQLEKAGMKDKVQRLININLFLQPFRLSWKKHKLTLIKEKILGQVHFISCGGAHLSKSLSDEMIMFGILVLQGYGATECAPLISVNRNFSNRTGSAGHILPSYEYKFVDGELWVKGPSVMKGYYKNPDLTEEVLHDGWFKTGDVGHVDKKGFLHISGRKKNLIVFKNGKKLSPEIIEAQLSNIPTIKDAVVYGASSGASIDDVKVAVSIYPDPQLTEGMGSYEILQNLHKSIEELNQKLPSYQQIQMINIRENEFFKTPLQKIKRHIE